METNSKRRALGRGLEELFSNEPLDYNQLETKIVNNTPKDEIIELSLTELRSNPYQPRKHFDEEALQDLANSIKEHGVFQPIIAKKSIKGYEIIAGERRVKASKLAGLEKVPAIVKDFTDNEMMEIALLENLQRENLSAIDEAGAYQNLLDSLKITQEKLSERLGKSRSHITNMLGLLSLPNEVKDMLVNNEISMGHARVLSKIEDKEKIIDLASKIIEQNLNVRETEELSANGSFKKKNINKKHEKKENEYTYVEELLCDKLGTKTKIKNNKIVINFTNTNDLNRLLEIMGFDK